MNVDFSNFAVVLGTLVATGGIGVFGFMKLFKKVSKVDADHILHLVTLVVSLAGAVAQYVLQLKGKLPPEVLGMTTATVYAASQLVFNTSKSLDGWLSQHYGQVESVLTGDVPKLTPTQVMTGVDTVVQDAKAVEQDFA